MLICASQQARMSYIPAHSFFSSAKAPEILGSLGDHVGTQLYLNPPLGRPPNGDVKENNRLFDAHGDAQLYNVMGAISSA
jgi:hypothetical protein